MSKKLKKMTPLIAIVLVIVMIVNTVWVSAAQVSIQRIEEENSEGTANNYLIDHTSYMTEDTLQRMYEVLTLYRTPTDWQGYEEQAGIYIAREEYDRAFFRLWTMKESYVKMTGEGMGLPFSEYELLVDACASLGYESSARVLRDGEVQDCYISEISLQGYIISICAESSAHMEVIWENSLFISTHHLDNVR